MASCPRVLQAAGRYPVEIQVLDIPPPPTYLSAALDWSPVASPRTQTLGSDQMRELILHITGMSCRHCLNAVSKALHSKPGVQVDSVEIGRAVVSYDERISDPAAIENAVAEAGYSATAVPAERGGAQELV